MFSPKGPILYLIVVLAVIAPAVCGQEKKTVEAQPSPARSTRTIEFETTQVTQADVTLSPDDKWLVFTMLGHLFRLPVAGGRAEQLTFGPYYDSDAVFSPDGKRIAFVSDREDSDRNIFVLELATSKITQFTREPWADRPVWSPDGQSIVYLNPVGEPRRLDPWLTVLPALVRRIRLGGGEPETLSAPRRLIPSVFYLPDGRLAWTVMEPQETGRITASVEVMSAEGVVSKLRTFDDFPDRVIASPKGDGVYCRCYAPSDQGPTTEHLVFLPLGQSAKREIAPLSRAVWLETVWHFREPVRFAAASDKKSIYVGDAGRLWKIEAASGIREPVPFTARIKLEIHNPIIPPKAAFVSPGSSAPPRVIQEPRLSPDGQNIVFGAAGYLWHQRLDGGPARRLSEGSGSENGPVFSPSGRQLLYLNQHGQEEIRVFSFETRETRTVSVGGDSWDRSWSPDGRRVIFGEEVDSKDRVTAVTLSNGKREKLADVSWNSPHISADGEWLFGSEGGKLYRILLSGQAKPEMATRLTGNINSGLVSPDGKWLAFRRNSDLWIAPFAGAQVEEKDIRLLTSEGTDGYAFTPDSSALLYAIGNHVWRHSLASGAREEIPIRLELQRPVPPPMLLRSVRVLDYAAGGFGRESSIYIEQGRIRWIGSERGKQIPRNAVIVDAGDRFAIPGLFDMHTHVGMTGTGIDQKVFTAYGVTSVRDVGAISLGRISALADRLELSAEPGPRLFYSGDTFAIQGGPNVNPIVVLRDEESARRYVRSWKAQGAHFIKAYSSLSWRLRRAVADEARSQGLPVVGHGMSVEEITKSVALGLISVEHFNRYSRSYDDIVLMLAASGTRWDPTMDAFWGTRLLLRNEPERLVDPKLRAFMSESLILQARRHSIPTNHNMLRGLWVTWLAGIKPAHGLGVKLLAGTDTPAFAILPGISLHWELEHLVEAGLSPLDVLRIATLNGAEAVGAQDDLGTLEAGKLADIVLLNKNPLENIKNTQTIWRVLKGGWLFDPDKLRPPEPASALK